MDYKETIKKRLDELSPELRAFVVDENWRRDAEKIGKQFNFDEEKYALFENEVFFVLLCFEPKTDFAENIKRELEIDSNVAGFVAEDVNKNIFSKVANEINSMWQSESAEGPEQSEGKEPQNTSSVGNSFEQIILNQAKAMQPAVPANRITNHELGIMNGKKEPPSNLPTSGESKNVPDYRSGEDPYREPVA